MWGMLDTWGGIQTDGGVQTGGSPTSPNHIHIPPEHADAQGSIGDI